METPSRPILDGLEAKWGERWESEGTYRFDRSRPRAEVYSIDTPPPTVSGLLHVGHVFSYTQTDIVARFQRMRGKAVFYPIGWDDNGLPTERRVQNHYGVRCEPSLAYDPGFQPPASPPSAPVSVSRPNFVELCERLSVEDERAYEELWRRLGLSYDWSHQYATISARPRRIAQRAFLRELKRGQIYRMEAPTLWDVDFQSAIAQAELKDKEIDGAYHRLSFELSEGGRLEIDTTRPELVVSCVALVAHPDDERFQPLFGKTAFTPLFGMEVPIRPHPLAEPDKGTGMAMVCTFGDLTDVLWWRELRLPARTLIGRDGRFAEAPIGEPGWESRDPQAAKAAAAEIAGLSAKQAQRRLVELLRASGDLVGDPTPIKHPVKFYEYGDRPLEIVSSRQWFVRTMDIRADLIARGRQIDWHPPFMRARYESWVEGLTGDWNITRQRFFGVPFPIWYPLDAEGQPIDEPIMAAEDSLPVDPSTDVPPGYAAEQRGRPGGFVGDPDVMDTWATSSLSPQIAGWWVDDPDLFERVYPMDLRPQAHEIIRTWLFSTVVRSHLENDSVPFRHAAVSGWIVDPDRKKMSKSRGKTVVPNEPIDLHGADAVRYWAGSARLGVDTIYDEGQMKIGRRLAIKLLNVSRFVLSRLDAEDAIGRSGGPGAAGATVGPGAADASAGPGAADAELTPLDAAMLAHLAAVVSEATRAFEALDYARALERTEAFFWTFCDDYVELVKARAYRDRSEPAAASARRALAVALSIMQRLFAPVMPYVTEEVWSWWKQGSVHLAEWPDAGSELAPLLHAAAPAVLDDVAAVLAGIRAAKTHHKVSMKAPVKLVRASGPASFVANVQAAAADLVDAGNLQGEATGAEVLELLVASDPEAQPIVHVELA